MSLISYSCMSLEEIIHVRLSRELRGRIKRVADSEKTSESDIVRRACEEFLRKRDAEIIAAKTLKDVVVDLLCKGFDPIALRQMGYNIDVIKEAFSEVKELAKMSEELQRFSSFQEKMKFQAEVCKHCKVIEKSLALLELEMLERKFLEYYLFVYIKTFGKLPILEILSRGDELAQYLKLAISLWFFLKEMKRKFSDEGIIPDDFVKKELGVPFLVFWKELENPENIVRILVEQQK